MKTLTNYIRICFKNIESCQYSAEDEEEVIDVNK
jgi:hypothetical protein